jgi:uncharacterized membrane protein
MYKPERLLAFCDGVIAIAITLLVLGLEVPSVHDVPEQKLLAYLQDALHPLLGFVSSFILIGTYWLQHYVIHHHVTHVDRRFVALTGLLLLCVSFVPFPTGLQASYRHDHLAMALYAVTQAICGLLLLSIWLYATHGRRLVSPQLSSEVVSSMSWRIAVTPLVSVAAIAVSFINLEASRLLFLVIPFAVFSHRRVDDEFRRLPEEGKAKTEE